MVFGLGAEFEQPEGAPGFVRGVAQHLDEELAVHMVRTGRRWL